MELVVRAGTSKTTLHKAGRPLIVQERDAGNVPTVRYTRGRDLSGTVDGAGGIGGLLARSHGYSSGSWAYHNFYHSDGNGNVTALVNSGGTLQASYIYDPYGRHLSGTGTLLTSNLMRFSSKPWVSFLSSSATSGLYYYGYRFYDPYLERWLNRDPVGEVSLALHFQRYRSLPVLHAYRYVLNNPLSASDAYGLYTAEEKECMERARARAEDCLRCAREAYDTMLTSVLAGYQGCIYWCLDRSLLFQPVCVAGCRSMLAFDWTLVTAIGIAHLHWCLAQYTFDVDACLGDRSVIISGY